MGLLFWGWWEGGGGGLLFFVGGGGGGGRGPPNFIKREQSMLTDSYPEPLIYKVLEVDQVKSAELTDLKCYPQSIHYVSV